MPEKQFLGLLRNSDNPERDCLSYPVQHYMGIPGELFTCIFAASRIIGWCAHVLEQIEDNKIIRPKANYIGYDLRSYVPVAER